jgi:hypothetical protein
MTAVRQVIFASVWCLLVVVCGCKPATTAKKLDPDTERELHEYDKRMEERQKLLSQNPDSEPVSISGTSTGSTPMASSGPEANSLSIASEPERVVGEFLEMLRNGQRFSAQRLLTTVAREQTARAGLELDAPGGLDTEYTLMATRYATSERLVAEVECLFHTADYKGDAVKISWLLRRQDNGWKIYGMSVQTEAGSLELVSFENADHLARISPQEPETDLSRPVERQASSENDDLRMR